MRKRIVHEDRMPQLEMPDIVGLPRNWDILIEYLRQRRYTLGDVEACIGVSRKVLKDWDPGGILAHLYQGLGSECLHKIAVHLYRSRGKFEESQKA